jgi:hypothetical protein
MYFNPKQIVFVETVGPNSKAVGRRTRKNKPQKLVWGFGKVRTAAAFPAGRIPVRIERDYAPSAFPVRLPSPRRF